MPIKRTTRNPGKTKPLEKKIMSGIPVEELIGMDIMPKPDHTKHKMIDVMRVPIEEVGVVERAIRSFAESLSDNFTKECNSRTEEELTSHDFYFASFYMALAKALDVSRRDLCKGAMEIKKSSLSMNTVAYFYTYTGCIHRTFMYHVEQLVTDDANKDDDMSIDGMFG